MTIRRIYLIVLLSLGCINWPCSHAAAAQERVDSKDESLLPLLVELSASEAFVDQPVVVRVRMRNNSSKPSAKRKMWLIVSTPEGTKTPTLDVPLLAPQESRELEALQFTPKRPGSFDLHCLILETVNDKHDQQANLPNEIIKIQVRFDPRIPIADLLPKITAKRKAGKTQLPLNLADVPEVLLHDPIAHSLPEKDAFEKIQQTIERINSINQKETDAFIKALATHRSDLAGLPFAMGEACRLPENRAAEFAAALGGFASVREDTAWFPFLGYDRACEARVKAFQGDMGCTTLENTARARVAAITQVITPENNRMRSCLVSYLGSTTGVEASAALARLAIFSEETDIRRLALHFLKYRPAEEYTAILTDGLNYPWPAVAQRASKAIAHLKLDDLRPQLIDMLESPDPRLPRLEKANGKKVLMMRELVRINHHRNCLLCHPPHAVQSEGKMPVRHAKVMSLLTAEVPLPTFALPQPSRSGGYFNFERKPNPEILIRIDVTYLRQDFSMKLRVSDEQPWPEMQRFDFLVRKREVSEEEARTYRELLAPRVPGALSPYQRAAMTALHELNGMDLELHGRQIAWIDNGRHGSRLHLLDELGDRNLMAEPWRYRLADRHPGLAVPECTPEGTANAQR